MRLIYFDVDTLRPDHLGCYGYHRATSPAIDAIAAEGVRLDNLYASDTPCLPSRSALITGRWGIHNGIVGHGGTAADLFLEGPSRGFRSTAARHSWVQSMRRVGMWAASISTFAERHSAFHFHAGFNETFNLGTLGMETADQVGAVAMDWLRRHGSRDNWFLHVHLWDPHTPYRAPADFGDPFASEPIPAWLTEDVRREHWLMAGPHSAQEIAGFEPRTVWEGFPRQPQTASNMGDVRRMFDGYDTAVLFADHHIGRIVDHLDSTGLLDETAIMVSSDHGETLGELGIYCDHQTADLHTTRLPGVLRWPGLNIAGQVDPGLHYQVDLAATVLELLGATVPDDWDGVSFAEGLERAQPRARDHLVLSHGAWTAQRAVRFADWLAIFTYHDGFHGFPEVMTFDVVADPHEQHDVAKPHPEIVAHAAHLLDQWHGDAMRRTNNGRDPLETVLQEDGPWHVRGHLDRYVKRLRDTGRAEWADRLTAAHPHEDAAVAPDRQIP